jgi:4'-phosphopantetheinyl transferase EntD
MAGDWHTAYPMWTGTELTEAMLAMAPPGMACAVHATGCDAEPLWPAELSAAGLMSAKRLREYSAGRQCAREALAHLGHAPVALPVGPGRAPLWPAGITGSISHTDEIAIAVVARQAQLRSLGIDVESAEPLDPDLRERVCRGEELAALAAAGLEPGAGAKLVFSAKESLYKCLWPLTGVFLEFHDISIRMDPVRSRFTACSDDPRIAESLTMTCGRYRSVGGLLLSCAWLDASGEEILTGAAASG